MPSVLFLLYPIRLQIAFFFILGKQYPLADWVKHDELHTPCLEAQATEKVPQNTQA